MREVGREVGDEWRTAEAPPHIVPPYIVPKSSEPIARAPVLRAPISWVHSQQPSSSDRFDTTQYPQQRPRRPSRGAAVRARRRNHRLAAVAVIAAGLAFAVLTGGGTALRTAQPMRTAGFGSAIDKALAWAGFGLDQISVTGHRFTPDGDILDALDLGSARNWRSFDSRAARDRIERLPWIATATLTRSYPGRLDVRVTERKAFGIWSHGDRTTMIDATGRSLSDIRPGVDGVSKLPRFKGAGADREAAAITALVGRHSLIQSRLALAERIAERRWTLHLDNGTTVHLPPDREAMVLDGLIATAELRRLIEEPGRVVDLRAPGRIAVRAKSGPMAVSPQRTPPRIASGGP